jgi:hypothetical protein
MYDWVFADYEWYVTKRHKLLAVPFQIQLVAQVVQYIELLEQPLPLPGRVI